MSCAAATADIHINQTITTIVKLLSTAAITIAPDRVQKQVAEHGVRQFVLKGYADEKLIMLPPLKHPMYDPWVNWIMAEYNHAWWLVTLAWFLAKEQGNRFGDGQARNPMYLQLQEWVKGGVTKVFPKKEKTGQTDWDFPVVVPHISPLKTQGLDPLVAYRLHYKELLASGTKMKWTGKPMPEWLGPIADPKWCMICQKNDPDARICGESRCPTKKNYNI